MDLANQETECRPCTIYRGSPVPSYWGPTDYPDWWDNGGRWGPPYALVQGGFPNPKIRHVEREMHCTEVKRGMVAWTGPRGIHSFVALAGHPERGHEHNIWCRVVEEDMYLLDSLVEDRPLKVLEKNVPVVMLCGSYCFSDKTNIIHMFDLMRNWYDTRIYVTIPHCCNPPDPLATRELRRLAALKDPVHEGCPSFDASASSVCGS